MQDLPLKPAEDEETIRMETMALEAQWSFENAGSDKLGNATEVPNEDNEAELDGEELGEEELQEPLDDPDANQEGGGRVDLVVGTQMVNDGLGDRLGAYQGPAFQNQGHSVSNA
jgi:hypothetical protein